MKKVVLTMALLLSISTSFAQETEVPNSLSNAKWNEKQIPGFLITNEGAKIEAVFNTHLPSTIRQVEAGDITYSIKGSTKVETSISDEYKAFQIDDKIFEKPNFTLKSAKKIKFMQPLAKGKIDMYIYIFRSSITMVNSVTKDIPSYYISYFLRKKDTNEEVIANEGAGFSKALALMMDNESIKKDYSVFKQYDILGSKEGAVKGLDLLKMVNDYNASK